MHDYTGIHCVFLGKDRQNVVVRISTMDTHGQIELAGDADLTAKLAALHIPLENGCNDNLVRFPQAMMRLDTRSRARPINAL